ncbi:unnamed protein product [Gulo gulo]|uniref:Uncharacterized protein n=1 Tax=Gulo gulo TaxID=48420 RepID=A0A9X9Q6R3_GULGU|nr:unnamed protein product [Gulo gulo]
MLPRAGEDAGMPFPSTGRSPGSSSPPRQLGGSSPTWRSHLVLNRWAAVAFFVLSFHCLFCCSFYLQGMEKIPTSSRFCVRTAGPAVVFVLSFCCLLCCLLCLKEWGKQRARGL